MIEKLTDDELLELMIEIFDSERAFQLLDRVPIKKGGGIWH